MERVENNFRKYFKLYDDVRVIIMIMMVWFLKNLFIKGILLEVYWDGFI